MGAEASVDGLAPKRLLVLVVVPGAADDAAVVAGLLPNKPPLGAVVEVDAEGADVAAALPKSPPPGAAFVVGVEAAGLAPNSELAVDAPEVAAWVEGAVWAVEPAALELEVPNRPPEDGADVAAGLFPNRPVEGVLPACAPAKRPEPVVVVVAGCVEEVVVVLGFAPNRLEVEVAGWALAGWKRLEAAGFEESAGGAPAGVVDARENIGLAGVVAGAAPWVVAGLLFAKSELPVLANRPEAGAGLAAAPGA